MYSPLTCRAAGDVGRHGRCTSGVKLRVKNLSEGSIFVAAKRASLKKCVCVCIYKEQMHCKFIIYMIIFMYVLYKYISMHMCIDNTNTNVCMYECICKKDLTSLTLLCSDT